MATSTYTYVSYYTDDDPGMQELKKAYQLLASDFESRKEHIDPKAAAAIERRLETLRHTWALLLEPVPKPFGG